MSLLLHGRTETSLNQKLNRAGKQQKGRGMGMSVTWFIVTTKSRCADLLTPQQRGVGRHSCCLHYYSAVIKYPAARRKGLLWLTVPGLHSHHGENDVAPAGSRAIATFRKQRELILIGLLIFYS